MNALNAHTQAFRHLGNAQQRHDTTLEAYLELCHRPDGPA